MDKYGKFNDFQPSANSYSPFPVLAWFVALTVVVSEQTQAVPTGPDCLVDIKGLVVEQ